MTETKLVLRAKVEQRLPILIVQSSPIDIPKVPTDSDPLAAAMLESQPRQTVPWPAWLTDKYEECTAPDAEDDLPDEDDGIFVIEDL